jgi:hypothetical protein
VGGKGIIIPWCEKLRGSDRSRSPGTRVRVTCPLTLREQVLLGLEDGLAKAVGLIEKTHQQWAYSLVRGIGWCGAHVDLNTKRGPNRAQ